MTKADRSRNGTGHTPTSALAPACCPGCGGHLVIACSDACGHPNPEFGVTGFVDPVARMRPPRVDAGVPAGPRPVVAGSTRDLVLKALAAAPGKMADLSVRLAMTHSKVSFMLVQLVRAGLVAQQIPAGKTRGAIYSIVPAASVPAAAVKICARCMRPIPPRRGRPSTFHEACLTAPERATLEQKRQWHAADVARKAVSA